MGYSIILFDQNRISSLFDSPWDHRIKLARYQVLHLLGLICRLALNLTISQSMKRRSSHLLARFLNHTTLNISILQPNVLNQITDFPNLNRFSIRRSCYYVDFFLKNNDNPQPKKSFLVSIGTKI